MLCWTSDAPFLWIAAKIESAFLIFPEGIGVYLGATLAVSCLKLQFLTLDAYCGAGRNGAGDKGVGADDGLTADDARTWKLNEQTWKRDLERQDSSTMQT